MVKPTSSKRLDRLETELIDIWQEITVNLSSVDRRLVIVGERLEQVTDAIAMLRLTLQNTQMASLTLHQREQLVDHRSSLYRQYD